MKVALIPAYNEEARIAPVILKARRYVDLVIVCDDGSIDLTSEVATSLGAVVIKHERNKGYGAALRTLFREAINRKADIAVTLDADGQHDPAFIPRLISPIEKGEADLVVGSRFMKGGRAEKIGLARALALKLLNLLGRRASKVPIKDTQSGMRAYSKSALKVALEAVEKGMGVSLGVLKEISKAKLRIKEVPIVVSYSGAKPSKNPLLHFSELILTILRMILEEKPLLYLGVPGSLMMIVSFYFGWWAMELYTSTKYFSIPMALISIGFAVIGILLIITSFQLYSISKIKWEIRKMKEYLELAS